MIVLAPLAGTVRSLADVPDPVFAERMVGPGLAIEPTDDVTVARAPVDGVVASLRTHAVVVRAGDRSVLVHLGIDTVGQDLGFVVGTRQDAPCRAGDALVTWRPAAVRASGRSALCPVVALQAPDDAVRALVAPGAVVAAGDPLLEWPGVAVEGPGG